MLSKIKAAIIWGKMRHRYLNRDYSGAAALAQQYKKTGVKNEVFAAFEATLDVLNHNSDEAVKKYKSVLESVINEKNNDKAYIYEYCMASIKAIENDLNQAERHRQNAMRIQSSKYVRKSLPLPNRQLAEL